MIIITYEECIKTALLKVDCEESDFDQKLFPIFANEAQMHIAKYGTHIIKKAEICAGSAPHTFVLPDDFYRIAATGIVKENDPLAGVDYYVGDEGYIVLNETGNFILYYWALPKDLTRLDGEALENYEFEVAKHTHVAIPSYIGYQLIKTEDTQLAQMLYDEWNRYMSLYDDPVRFVRKKIY